MPLSRILPAVCIAAALGGVAAARADDPMPGEHVFKTQCAICHSPVAGKNMIGPSLFGVVGREAGSVPNFRYSAANKNSGLTWDEATLERYLQAPRTVVPGTLMTYAGLKDETQRAELIAWLATLK